MTILITTILCTFVLAFFIASIAEQDAVDKHKRGEVKLIVVFFMFNLWLLSLVTSDLLAHAKLIT